MKKILILTLSTLSLFSNAAEISTHIRDEKGCELINSDVAPMLGLKAQKTFDFRNTCAKPYYDVYGDAVVVNYSVLSQDGKSTLIYKTDELEGKLTIQLSILHSVFNSSIETINVNGTNLKWSSNGPESEAGMAYLTNEFQTKNTVTFIKDKQTAVFSARGFSSAYSDYTQERAWFEKNKKLRITQKASDQIKEKENAL